MMYFTTLLAALSSVAAVNALALDKRATTHYVTVGAGGKDAFSSCTQAKIGDKVVFQFKGPHTVTQSTFANPCSPLSGGFDSGVLTSGSTYTVQVTSNTSIWLYSAIAGECQRGFVTAINAPESGPDSFDNYLANAKAVAQTSAVTQPVTATHSTSAGVVTITAGTSSSPAGGAGTVTTTVFTTTSASSGPVTTTLTTVTEVPTTGTVTFTSSGSVIVSASTGSESVTTAFPSTVTDGGAASTTSGGVGAATTTATKSSALGRAGVPQSAVIAVLVGAAGIFFGSAML